MPTLLENPTDRLIEELMQMEEKAEIIGGEIVLMGNTGQEPNIVAGEIFASLREFARRTQIGRAFTDGLICRVDLPNRQSMTPDVAFVKGQRTGCMRAYDGAPIFVVEVRSEGDYGFYAESKIHEKIADYFAAGTLVVWDVDPESNPVVRKYSAPNADVPQIFARGEVADAEPAVAGWKMNVDEIFE